MRHRDERLLALAILGLAVLCYASIIPTYFVSDDFSLIARAAGQGMFYVFARGRGGFIRPGTALSYVIDHWAWGLNPIGYHLTNILFHSVAACGVFSVARHVFTETGSEKPPLLLPGFAACLFVVLPCHSESVSWISGRTDVIAVALGLWATSCLLVVVKKRSSLHMALALGLLVAALLTKECVIALPPIWCAIVAHHAWSRKSAPSRDLVILAALSCVILAGYFGMRKAILGQFIGGYGTATHIAFVNWSSVTNLLRYVYRTVVPAISLGVDNMNEATLLAAVAVVLGAFIVACIVQKRFNTAQWSVLTLLAACYLLSLIPVITMEVELFDTRNERFLYLPSTFACVLIVYVVAKSIHQRMSTAVLAALILLEAGALQLTNTRWITASYISRQIASEVSRTDPAHTMILNIPDNFRGAYIFHNGLQDAATTFAGNPAPAPYRWICVHDVNSVDEVFDVKADSTSVALTLPEGAVVRGDVHAFGYRLTRKGGSLVVSEMAASDGAIEQLLSFTTAASKPMLSRVWSR